MRVMKILITQGHSRLARALGRRFSTSDIVKLTTTRAFVDEYAGSGGPGAVACELHHDEATDRLVEGVHAIIHVAYDPDGAAGASSCDSPDLLDYHTRRTYNLLTAAAAAGVKRFICLSTLRLLEGYEENLTVTERWRPLPPAEDAHLLGCHLGEMVCKEFARDRLIEVVTIRLGFPIVYGDRGAAAATGESAAVSVEDVFSVVGRALTSDIGQWQAVHVQSPAPGQRFLMHAAGELFDFPGGAGEGEG